MNEPAHAAAGVAIDVTNYSNVRAPMPTAHAAVRWADFVREWTARGHPEYATKDSAPLWGPHRLRAGMGRANGNVLQVSAAVFDIDMGGPIVVGDTFGALQAAGIAFLAHTSFTHDPTKCGCVKCEKDRKAREKAGAPESNPGAACPTFVERWKVRVIVPMSEAVIASAWGHIHTALRARFSPHSDQQCSDHARQYYIASKAPGTAVDHWIVSEPGRALAGTDIVAAPFSVVPAGTVPLPLRDRRALTEQALRRLQKRLLGSKKLAVAEIGERMGKLLNGEPYGETGERDSVTWELCREIARAYPDAEPRSVASFFERSLSLMSNTKVTFDSVIEKVTRAQGAAQGRVVHEVRDSESRNRILFGDHRVTNYEPDELNAFAATLEVDRADLHRYLILLDGVDVYMMTPGPDYTRASKTSIAASAYSLLGAMPEPFSLTDADGVPKASEQLLREYSTPIQGVIRSLYDRAPKIEERKLILPTAPLRELLPHFDAQIDEWLKLLAGAAYADLQTWLALATNMRTPLPALVMIGDKGSGKSLLAMGLARLWGRHGPTTLDQAMGAFNDGIERQPLIFGDEHVPRDFRGNVRTEELRCLIQQTEHRTQQKHRDHGSLRGAVRVVIAANNEAVIELRGHLTKEDVDAIAERLFYLEIKGQAAAEYLKGIGGRARTEAWVAGDGIARHVLALPAAEVTSRFGFLPGRTGDLAKRIAVRSGSRSTICEWIVKGLAERFVRVRGRYGRLGDSLLLPLATVFDEYETYTGRGDKPQLSTVASALEGVSLGRADEYQVIDLDMLRAWCLEHGYAAPEQIDTWVAALPEIP